MSVHRWNLVVDKLKEAHAKGMLGVIAACTKVPEYKLHDIAKSQVDVKHEPLTPYELTKLYEYFRGKSQ